MIVAEPSTFGARLKELREKANVSQYRLAQISGVSKQTISQLEKPGGGDPSWDTVKRLAKALDVPIDEFVTDEPEEASAEEPEPEPAPKKKPKGKK